MFVKNMEINKNISSSFNILLIKFALLLIENMF